jgi:hypothetical protein
MTYTKMFMTRLIATTNPDALEEKYERFLRSLDDVGTEIISVNYQVATYQMEEETMPAGISFSVLVTYSVMGWVEEPVTEHGLREVKNE